MAEDELLLQRHVVRAHNEQLAQVRVAVGDDIHKIELCIFRVLVVGLENRLHRRPVDQVAAPAQGDMPLPRTPPPLAEVRMLMGARCEYVALVHRVGGKRVAVAIEREHRREVHPPVDAVRAEAHSNALGIDRIVVLRVESGDEAIFRVPRAIWKHVPRLFSQDRSVRRRPVREANDVVLIRAVEEHAAQWELLPLEAVRTDRIAARRSLVGERRKILAVGGAIVGIVPAPEYLVLRVPENHAIQWILQRGDRAVRSEPFPAFGGDDHRFGALLDWA